jgi:hypothetical protein
MLQQPPRRRTSLSSTTTEVEKSEKLKNFKMPEYTELEIERLLDPSNIQRKVEDMRRNGRLSALAETEVTSDVVDSVRWLDQKSDELKGMKIQDIQNQKPWLDELQEDFVTYDLAPSVAPEEARTILTELRKEIDAKQNAGFGPEARTYLYNLQRELEVLIEKL